MKINSIELSNVLCFKQSVDYNSATKITFDHNLNFLIGENGSGKSTVIEAINFILNNVLFLHWKVNVSNSQKGDFELLRSSNENLSKYRLGPNMDSLNGEQYIRFEVELDEVDKANMALITKHKVELENFGKHHCKETINYDFSNCQDVQSVYVNLNWRRSIFTTSPIVHDSGLEYLTNYNLYRVLIERYNTQSPSSRIDTLHKPFSLLGSYREYQSISTEISLTPDNNINDVNYENQSIIELLAGKIPAIFEKVLFDLASKHSISLVDGGAEKANLEISNEELLRRINAKLNLINLKLEVKLVEPITWKYTWQIIDIRRGKVFPDINGLSSGQNAIMHLIFEAYGHNNLKGGVVIIDEPEIHLHYQLQREYLKIIEELNSEQKCQYILVTHSESLINSSTISHVKRFSLVKGYSEVRSPQLTSDQKTLIKILDNIRSTYAFFAEKVVLVEGDTDRYFFQSVLTELLPDATQQVAILHMQGKGNYQTWKEFFNAFGLTVYYIGDFDNVFTFKTNGTVIVSESEKNKIYEELRQQKLDNLEEKERNGLKEALEKLYRDPNKFSSPNKKLWDAVKDRIVNCVRVSNEEVVKEARSRFSLIDKQITENYKENTFILKEGSIEAYIGTRHGDLNAVVDFCSTKLKPWLSKSDSKVKEIKDIINTVCSK